jgi:3-methyladenine DNA glycosylase AlkD
MAARTGTKARAARRSTPAKSRGSNAAPALDDQVRTALSWLEAKSTRKDLENLPRFGITADKAYGVSLAHIQAIAKRLGRSHALAEALWKTGWYEARLLASFVDQPDRVTPAQMDRWCRDFDNWGICDTVCFHLFDRTPHAWAKVAAWSDKRQEFEKRAAFALLASIAGHDKTAADAPFLESLRLIERAAPDDRNFVKKGVSWALRRIGSRSRGLNTAAIAVARRLAASDAPAARWIGKDALREFDRPATKRRLAASR